MTEAPRPLFAVVREDSIVERRLIERSGTGAALVVASGGCTAFDLVCACPDLEVVAFDRSPRQLDLVRVKMSALASGDRALLDEPSPLLHEGAFEGLFRLLRRSLEEFVTGPNGLQRYFTEPSFEARSALAHEDRFMLRALDPQGATPLACRVHCIEADLTRSASGDRLRIAIAGAAVARRLH